MDSFVFDLQLFAVVNYANPAESGNDPNHGKHAITLDTTQYYALADETKIPTAEVKIRTVNGLYGDLTKVPSEGTKTYFFGVDGKLYGRSTTPANNNAMAEYLRRNETAKGKDTAEVRPEHFFLGTVTIGAEGKVSVTTFGGDNMWYGESVEILKDAEYTVQGDGYIYSIGASDGAMEGAVFFELPTTTASYGGGEYKFSVDGTTGAVTFTKKPNNDFVRLLSGDLTVDLSAAGASAPTNIVFMNGNDDAYNNPKRERGYSYKGDWAARKGRNTDIAAVGMNDKLSTSIKFTGITNPTNVEVNNRTYTVSSGIQFYRDYTDDGNADGTEPGSTSRIGHIDGTVGKDTLIVKDSTTAKSTDIAVLSDISLGEGDDTLTIVPASGKTISLGGDLLLGKGNDTVSIGGDGTTTIEGDVDLGDDGGTVEIIGAGATSIKGSLELGDGENTVTISATGKVDIKGGITGGDGVDTYVLSGVASAAEKITTITINNFGDGDKLTVGTAEVANPIPAESTKNYIVTAANNVTGQKGAVTIYMNYADLASAPAFDYQDWIRKSDTTETETRQIVFTSDGSASGDAYVTLSRDNTTGIDVTVAEAAVGKFSTVNLGENAVTANITLGSTDMTRLSSGVKANTVTFKIGGKSVQLTATTATVGYAKTGDVFTLPANAVMTDATGTLTVNTVAYELGTAKMQITGAATNDPNTIVLSAGNTDIKVGDNTYALTADGATLTVKTSSTPGDLTLTDGSLTMTIPAATGDNIAQASRTITVKGKAYTLNRAAVSGTSVTAPLRDLTVSSEGVVSKMDAGDTFTVDTNDAYTVYEKLIVHENSSAFSVFSTGAAIAAASTFDGTTLTVGGATAKAEAIKSYASDAISEGVLTLANSTDDGVQLYGATAVTNITTADNVAAAYNAAQYKVTRTATTKFVISAGANATAGTATTVDVKLLGNNAVISVDGTSLVNFVTLHTAFSVSEADRAKMKITQTSAGPDTVTGAVALTLTGTGAQALTLETVGATAKVAYTDGNTGKATIDGKAYLVLSSGDTTKTLTVKKGETADTVTVTAATNVMIGSTYYAVTTASTTFVGGALETGSVTITDATAYSSVNIPLEQNTDAMKIAALSYEDGAKHTSVEVVAENGVATVLKGFGDNVGETITIGATNDSAGYTYRVATVDGANVIQRKVMGANDSTYITMKATPFGYSSSIALADLTDVTQWGTDATAYALGGTNKNELTLSDSTFGSWTAETTTRVFNLQKDGVTVAVLRQTAAKAFTIERGAGTDAVNISIVAAKTDTGAIIRTKGFVSTDTVTANVAKISDQDVSLTLNGTQYDIPKNIGDVSVAVTEETAGNGSKLVTGKVTLTLEASDVAANNSVTVADGSVITITGGTASASITVTAAGVVSGLAGGDVFTITNADGLTTKYTVAANKITAENGYYGEYSVTNLTNVTVTSTAGQSNVVKESTETDPKKPTTDGTNELSVTLAEGKYVLVKVAKNGSTITGYTATATSDTVPDWTTRAEAADGGVIGYFQTVTDGTGKTTVTYVGDTIGMPVNLVATSITKTTNNVDVVADAADIEALSLTNVAAGQSVTHNGATDASMTYTNQKKSVLGDTKTITISADAVKYFLVETDGAAVNGVQKYKVGANTATSTPAAGTSYFTVTKAGASEPHTYTITYHTPDDNPATEGDDGHLELTDASWANIVVDAGAVTATATNGATKIIIEPAAGISGTGWADKYTLTNAKAGVAVQEADGAKTSGYINPVVYSNAYTKEIAGGPINLATYFAGAKTAVYFKVTSETVNGITTVTLGAALDEAPTSTADNAVSYLAFTRNGTVITAEYMNNAGIPLTGLKNSTPTALKVSVVATGLTFGTDATKNQVSGIVITDDTAASKNVDYNLTGVPGGVKVTGATDGKDTVAWAYTYDFNIVFDLKTDLVDGSSAAAVTKYYALKVPADKEAVNGVKTLTVDDAANSTTGITGGYFTVVYNVGGSTSNQVSVTYVQNGGLALNTGVVDGAVIKIDAHDLDVVTTAATGKLVDITVTQGTNGPTNFVVTNLDNTVTDATAVVKKAGTETVNYLYEYTYAADKVVLGDLQPGGTKYFVVTKATGKDAHTDMATNQSLKGVTTYTVAAGVDTVPNATDNYITAKNVDGVITLTYHQSTTTASAINLAEGGSQITVDASGLQDDTDVANTITLTADANINYNVTGLPYSVTNGNPAEYRKTYTLTDQAIALTNNNLGTTVYYEVAAGTATRGRAAVTLTERATRLALSGLSEPPTKTENEIATALKGKNYFTVITSAAGVVSIAYTEAETGTAIKLSDATGYIGVNANGTTADKITGITIEQGGDANYQLQNLRGATTITKTDEGSTVTVDNYVPTYVIDGKIELSATGTGIVYYDLVRTESDTKIVTYKLGAAATTHTESNYFAVNYNAVDQGKVFVSYVNVGTDEYDLDDASKIGLGKVGIDATSLPKGVATIDISERGKSGDCEVRYEITGVPATAEVVDATHGVTGDTVTKALNYAFKANEKITVYASSTGDVITYIKSTDVTTNGVKTGETYTFDGTAGDNVGSVTITKATAGGATTYTVKYTAGSTKDPVKLSGGQIALDASTITDANVTIVKKASDTGSYAITGAKGDVTFKGLATDGSDTVKYSTTFAWTNGTYYAAMADAITLDAATATAVVPAAGTNYLALTVDSTNGKVSYAWMTPNEKNGVMEKLETAPTFTGRVTITAPAAGTYDVSGFDTLGVDIVKVASGTNFTKLGSDTTVTMTATGTASAPTGTMTVAGKTYTAGALYQDDGETKNAIKVSSDGVVSGIVKITKQTDTTQTLTAANKKSGATTAETVWVETASTEATEGYDGVMVSFGANGIEYIAGLDVGEVVRIREKDGIEYVYTTTDGLLISRTSAAAGSTPTYLGLDAKGSAFFYGDAKYGDLPTADSYTTGFEWKANTTTTPYYVSVTKGASGTGIDGTATINTSGGGETKTATAGEYLLAVTMTESSGIFTMNVTPKVVDGTKKIVDPTDGAAFIGTVTLDMAASSAKPVILDVTGKTYVLNVTSAKAGSVFTGLGGEDAQTPAQAYNDAVTTAALDKGQSVTVNGAVYESAEDAFVMNFAKAGTTTVWGLKTTAAKKVTVKGTSGTLTTFGRDNVAELISYTAGTVSDGVEVTVDSTQPDAITSITGLTGGESVTVKNGDVTTVYTANADGTEITRSITEANGTVNTRTIKDVAAGDDILSTANKAKWDAAANTITNTLDWAKDSIGYFKVVNNVAAVAAGETAIASTDTDTYVAAKVEIDAKTGVATLTLTGKTVTAGVVGADANLAATNVVKVTLADGTLVNYAKGTTVTNAAVQISGAKAGSVFTDMALDTDQVTTAALALNDAIFFNKTKTPAVPTDPFVITPVISAAADNTLTIAGNSSDSSHPRIVAGSVQVGGKYAGSDEAVKTALGPTLAVGTTAYGSDNVLSVVYTAGTKDTEAKDGVIATFTNGNPTSITGLTNGEKVVVTYKQSDGTAGDTYTYTAENEAGTEIKCVYVCKSDASKNWTRYCTTMTTGGNILDGTYANTTTTSIFNWSATKEATATSATGYFEISAADGTATVLDQTDPATSTVIKAGDKKHYVDITATKDAAGVVTISKIGEVVVGIDGTISDVQDAGGEGILKRVTLQLPAGTGNVGTVVKANVPADRTEVPAFTATNVGNGSVIGGNLTAADVIETATAFASGDAITISDKTYTAGATGKLKIYGDGKVEDGTLKLHTRAAYGLSEVTTYFVNTDMSRVSETIAYATSEKTITGAIVTIVDGVATGLTQLGANETVTITKTVTDKTGTASVVTTTYTATANADGTLTYTKTKDDNGVKTVSTGIGMGTNIDLIAQDDDPTTDPLPASYWSTTGTTAKSQFNWANTGFFLLGDGVYTGTIALAAQDTAVSINKSKVGNVYLRVETDASGNSAKGYEITSMRLVEVQRDGSFSEVYASAKKVTVNVTAPSAGVDFGTRTDANIVLNVTGATAGKLYEGLAKGDSIAWSSAAVGDKLYVNGTAYISGAASNAVTLKKDETTGDVEVTQGTLVVDNNKTLNSSVKYGATVEVGNVAGKDGVIVTYGADGHVSSVTDLEDTETVTITEKRVETIWEKNGDPDVVVTEDVAKAANEAAEKAGEAAAYLKRVVTTTIEKAYTAGAKNKDGSSDIRVTVTTKVGETLDGSTVADAAMKNVKIRTETWTKKAVAATDDVISLTGYTTADKFTWANNAGSAVTGYFAITENAATVEKQTAAPEISTTATYLKVVTTAASTEAAAAANQIVALTYDTTLNAWVETDFTGTVTIPATGNLNVSAITNRAREAYNINVTNAGTGKTFLGFTADDTITTATTFYKGNYITVGTTKLVAAADGQIIANGDAEAISGTFKIDKTDVTSIVLPENAAGSSYSVAYSTTLASGDATIVVKDGAIQEIRDIASGETVVVTITDANNKVVTETYAATAGSGADETKITKTVADGVTTTTSTATLKASEKYSDIYGAAYTESSKETVSQFAWTNVADGYFVPTFDSEKNTYTATIAPQASPLTIPGTAPATVYKAGDKFLKVTRTAATATENQTITAISLVELQSDGSFRDVTSNLGTGSTVAITLPSDTAITYAKAAGALYGVQLSVPATGSKITGLKSVDAIGTNPNTGETTYGQYVPGYAYGIVNGTTLGATGMTIATAATASVKVTVNGMNFKAADAAGLTIQANTASDTFLTKGTLTLDTSTTIIDPTKSTYGTNPDSAVMIQKLVKAVAPATEDTTGDKIIVTAADTDATGTVTVDIYGSFDATTLTSASAANLTITATNTSGTVIEKYAVDYYGNITATNAAGSTKYYLAAAPTGKIILDGTIDSTFDNAALVVDAPYDTTSPSGYKATLLDNSRTTYYAVPTAGERLLSATYTKATAEGAKDTYAIAGLSGNNVKEIDTTALTSDKVTIDSTNLTAANIKLTDATGTTAVVKLASGTMTLEAGAISGVTALTLVSGELVNASGITALTIDASKAAVNGVAYKDAQGAVVTAVKDGESYTSQLVSGYVTVATGDDALKLSGGSTVTVTGSVQVYATAGAVSSIYDFQKGEKVAIRTGTTTTTYEAISETNIKVTTQPDSGTATTAMATLTGNFFNLPLATYEALTTAAGDIDWASTTAKTTYRLVPAAGSTVDLSAASKQRSFSYADVDTKLYATTVTAGTNTLTVTVKEIVVDEKGALTADADAATTLADAGRFTLTTGTLTKGTAVTLNGASTLGQPHTYTTAKDSPLTVEGNGAIVNGSLVLATTLTTTVDGVVTLGGTTGSTANTVTVANGKVTAISGLDAGESVTIGSVKYEAKQTGTGDTAKYEIIKTVTKADGTEVKSTATVTADTMKEEFSLEGGLPFTTEAVSTATETAGAGQGQFQWATADTRGVGYFLIQKASATKTPTSITVADQPTKTVFTTKEDGNTYLVASLENGGLTLSAQKAAVKTNAETLLDEVTFSDAAYYGTVKLNVAKDYTGTVNYDAPSDRTYNVEFTNVTKGSRLTNLGKSVSGLVDKVTTAALAENETVTVNDITYTAGAKGALTFQNGKLYSGTVKLSAALANSIVTTGNEKKGTASMTVSGATFVGDDTNEVLVKVANGEITSITGLVNQGESITVTDNTTSAEYVYSVLDSAGTMIKRASDGSTAYATIKNGGNVYVTNEKSWNPGVTFGPGGTMVVKNTTMTADSKFWSGNTVRYYKIGNSTNLANGVWAELVTSATEGEQGDYYIAVTAKETKTGAQITGVTLMQVSATGELKKASTTLEKSYKGGFSLEAETALVYSAAATRNWHFNITGVKADSKITNLNEGDKVTTGDVSYQGTVTVDSLKYVSGDKAATQTMEIDGGKPDAVTSTGVFEMSNGAKTLTTTTGDVANGGTIYTVKYGGGKDTLAVTVSEGEVTAITGLGTTATSGTVTLEEVNALGKTTTTYTLAKGVITKTMMTTAGTELTSTATNTAGFELIGGDYSDATLKDVAYNFTWTDAGTTGYFKVTNLAKAATVKVAKGTIKTTDSSYYLAVTLGDATATSATINSIKVQRMNRTDNTGMDDVEAASFTGALTLTVPKGIALKFDRSVLANTNTENAKLAFTGVANGSEIKNLNAGETVTTGALLENEIVNVNGSVLQAGAKNATLKVTAIDTADVKVDSGRVKLVAENANGYVEEITVNKDKNTTAIVGVSKGTIVVNATATGYTVEGLGVGEEFTVTEGSSIVSYKVSESTILRVKDGVTAVYKMSAATIAKGTASIGSAVLAKESNWLVSTAYASDAHKAVTARAKIDLKAADTALTKADKAGTMMPDYYFVTDEAIDSKTVQTKNGVIATTMVETTGKQTWELNIGAVTTDEDVSGDNIKDRTYTASDTMGQNILAANGWKVTGGSGDDTMTGAASGSDTLVGGSGNDSMVGGGANDYFVHTGGKDTISKYTSGKDKVSFENGFDAVALNKSDVTLGSSESDMLVLIGAAASQANGVTISNGGAEATYYFGKSTAAANFTKLTDGAYYYGQSGQKNKITVSTDKTKASKTALGENQTVNLSETAHYHNITEVNATGSANKVYLKANDAATTDTTILRGGSYMTTLVGGQGHDTMFGGSGNDFFQFNEYSGTDVISKYDGKKDTLYVAGGLGYWEISSDNKHLYLKSSKEDKESIKLENVVGGTAVNVATDSEGSSVTSYFFGKAKAANTFTGTDNTDPTKGAAQHTDVFFVNQLAKSTTVKFFGVGDEIRIEVSKAGGYSVSEVMAMMDSTKSKGANSVYSIENQTLTISDKNYSMSSLNTEVTTSGTTMTIKRTK